MASFPRQPAYGGTRKVKTILDFNKATDDGGHQLDHMQIICTLLQIDNHASISAALPDAQPTVSKH